MPVAPQPESESFLTRLGEAQAILDAAYSALPPSAPPTLDQPAAEILAEAAARLGHDDPYHHPLYAGQMLKPPHPIARAAYTLAMSLNPNNHALDGGRASSAMELEAIAALAAMFHVKQYLGHLTSGGTFANLEALWVAGQIAAEQGTARTVAASTQAHYTHARISGVLGLPFVSIPVDTHGRMDLAALETALRTQSIGTVVATLGTTATGAVDPLQGIVELQARYRFRIHVDAAYGGYFNLASNLAPETRSAFDAIPRADSIVVDPHKHGLQPYGCGSVLFSDPTVGRFYKHDSPYTYFTSSDLHLGEISLECSRAGAAAVALWATQKLLPYVPGGEFARGLDSSRSAALALHRLLLGDPQFILPIAHPELDIVVWAVRAATPESSSALAHAVFDQARTSGLYLALAKLPVSFFAPHTWLESQSAYVTCLRSVLMKPEHLAWIDRIWARLQQATAAVNPPERTSGMTKND